MKHQEGIFCRMYGLSGQQNDGTHGSGQSVVIGMDISLGRMDCVKYGQAVEYGSARRVDPDVYLGTGFFELPEIGDEPSGCNGFLPPAVADHSIDQDFGFSGRFVADFIIRLFHAAEV